MNLGSKILFSCIAAAVAFVFGASLPAKSSKKKEARVTQIIKEVNLLSAGEEPRAAVQNDEVKENTAVRTGDESRSELTFDDLTITRLGANTVFTFNKAGRSGQLESGAILLRVPKDSGGAEFKTRAVTVGVTGTTVIFESTRLGNSKLIVLEGGARLRLNKYPQESVKVRVGQMLSVPAGAIKVPPPENVDLDQVAKTHPLLTDFPPLPSDELIRTAIKKQSGGPGGSPPPPVNAGTPSAVAPTGPASASTRTTILPPAPKRTRPPRTSTNNPPSTPTPTPKTGPTRPPKGGGTKVTPTPTPQRTLLRPTGNALGPGAGSNQPKKTIRPPPPTPTPPVIR